MPQALATALVPLLSNAFLAIGLPSLAFGATVGAIALGASYLLLAGAAYLIQMAFAPAKPEAPKPEDGKYNLKQSVPPLVYVMGRVKKAGDYAFLEESGGTAWHITVFAAHHILGYVRHFLHDEPTEIDGGGTVTSPTHFSNKVRILTRLGDAASTAYTEVVAAFPGIWTADHRGDGLATVEMDVQSVAADALQTVFPNQMPAHSAILNGHDQLIDPRTGIAGYSTNFAIFRYWHLTHPVGGKLSTTDLYTPDWANAAISCDSDVVNRQGVTQRRYHGGFWFRANNDPVAIGRLMDQAGELVIYERADGKVGVHAGEFVEPDVRLTALDIISISYDPNKRRSTNVLAVRGRYTDIDKGFNTADAAIYGAPYPTEDERTKTVENQAVQNHNHMARLQKLAFIRANAPRVKLVVHFEPARNVPYRRFVKVHYPPKLTEAIVEITGRPTLSLRNLTYEFEGIVVPANLYAFDAATEEGLAGANVAAVTRHDVPAPVGFDVDIETETVSDGSSGAFALATFTFQNATFQYELEWQLLSGGAVQTVLGAAGALSVRTGYLAIGVPYRFRARTWSGGTSSAWTTYENRTATGDVTPPGPPIITHVGLSGSDVLVEWQMPNSANVYAARVWRATTGSLFSTATDISGQVLGSPNQLLGILDGSAGFGSWDYWVTAENAGGYASVPDGPATQVVP